MWEINLNFRYTLTKFTYLWDTKPVFEGLTDFPTVLFHQKLRYNTHVYPQCHLHSFVCRGLDHLRLAEVHKHHQPPQKKVELSTPQPRTLSHCRTIKAVSWMFVVTSLLLTIHITTVSQMPCCLWLNICWWRQTSNTPWISRKFATPTPDLQVLVSFYWPDVAEQFSKISPAILIKRYAFSCIVPCLWCSIWTLFLNSFL